MSDAALNYPQHLTRQEPYFELLDDFLKTSARYLDVDAPLPGQAMLRDRYPRMVRIEALR
jgi:hypothetical protein